MSLRHLNVWPVVQREMRETARRPVNHRLRLFSAGVGTLLLWVVLKSVDLPPAATGGWLFGWLHTLLIGLILMIVPALTADCIAREKREGTLGLLFLTPMNAGGIVAGKALAHGLRAFTLWLAVVPVLTIPFLTGGVTWFDALSALSVEFCAAVLCLGAGLLASSLAQRRNAVFMLALVFGAFFLFAVTQLGQLVLIASWRGSGFLGQDDWWSISWDMLALFSGLFNNRGGRGWSSIATFSPVLSDLWKWFCLAAPIVALLLFCMIASFSAFRVRRSWQDKIPSPRREFLLRRYCTPVFQRYFRRHMQRTLDANPIAWLQQYSWKARLSKWGLCLAFVMTVTAAVSIGPDTLGAAEFLLLLTLAGIYTFFGVAGFLEEKRSGALELLLITPISVNALIFGRVWGLWKQFLPAALILIGGYLGSAWMEGISRTNWHEFTQGLFVIACGFLALPIFATYFALRVKNLIVAAVLTWIALCVPVLLVLSEFVYDDQSVFTSLPAIAFFTYLGLSSVVCFLLRHSLSRRIYSF
jgi:ABC-type Na+ efflux pump permease subunit